MKKFAKIYSFVSQTILSAILIFGVLNLLAFLILKLNSNDDSANDLYNVMNYKAYEVSNLDSNYVNKMIESAISFLKNGEDEFIYHPATEYQLNAFSFGSVTVHSFENDFNRRISFFDSVNSNCLNTKAIYCFGGSTTYGSFVEDKDSWPAQLGTILAKDQECIIVKNYGVPGFVPTQETNQFIHLLKMGHRPSLAIFMDGYNVGPTFDGSDFSKTISNKFLWKQATFSSLPEIFSALPILQWIKGESYSSKLEIAMSKEEDIADLHNTSEWNDEIINRFIQNARLREAIAQLYNIPIIQILQPNSYVSYNTAWLAPLPQQWLSESNANLIKNNYTAIYAAIDSSDAQFLNYAYLFEKYNKPAVVDVIHYSPGFNQFLANEIALQIQLDSLANFEIYPQLSSGTTFK